MDGPPGPAGPAGPKGDRVRSTFLFNKLSAGFGFISALGYMYMLSLVLGVSTVKLAHFKVTVYDSL